MIDKEENENSFHEEMQEEPISTSSSFEEENDAVEEKPWEPKEKHERKDLHKELHEYKDKYLRLLADMENSRRRMQKEKQETIRFSIENTVSEFLPSMDNFENALKFAQNSSKEVEQWASGFQMILSQFRDVLHNHGIVAFHSEGNMFDPHFHEAMEIVETNDHPDGTIIEEYAKGYKSGNRTLRPAKVKVARASLQEDINEQEKNNEE